MMANSAQMTFCITQELLRCAFSGSGLPSISICLGNTEHSDWLNFVDIGCTFIPGADTRQSSHHDAWHVLSIMPRWLPLAHDGVACAIWYRWHVEKLLSMRVTIGLFQSRVHDSDHGDCNFRHQAAEMSKCTSCSRTYGTRTDLHVISNLLLLFSTVVFQFNPPLLWYNNCARRYMEMIIR